LKCSVGKIESGRMAWTFEDEKQRRTPATHAESFRQKRSTELVTASTWRREEIVRLPLKNRARRILTRQPLPSPLSQRGLLHMASERTA
jgi:hypothetical protein